MPVTINGTTGVVGPDGSASSPAIQGGDANTGIFFPAADTIAFATAGTEDMRIDSVGNVGIGTSAPTELLTINGAGKAVVRYLNSGTFAGIVGIDNASYVSGTNGDLLLLSGASKSVVLGVNGGTRAAVVDSAANFLFNSGYGSAAVAYGCRAWVNFNGTGTVAIRASGNVSSITDNNTGDYTVNFTNAMPDANYQPTVNIQRGDGAGVNPGYGCIYATAANAYTSITTGSVRVITANSATAAMDMIYVGVSIFR